jgi:hypothetical protein
MKKYVCFNQWTNNQLFDNDICLIAEILIDRPNEIFCILWLAFPSRIDGINTTNNPALCTPVFIQLVAHEQSRTQAEAGI